MKRLTLIIIGAVFQTLLVSQAPALAVDAETVVTGKCTACHDVDKIREAKKSETEWKLLVDKEIERGASLDEAERVAVVDWLAENYGEANQAGAAATAPTSNTQSETTATLPFDEQAYTGAEMWHFLLGGFALLAGGVWMKRRDLSSF